MVAAHLEQLLLERDEVLAHVALRLRGRRAQLQAHRAAAHERVDGVARREQRARVEVYVEARRAELTERTEHHHRIRLPFFSDLTFQSALLEVATGLGGLAVVVTGAMLVNAGLLESAMLPLLTLLAMAAFLPISEISEVSRQLADTLGSTRRLYAVEHEPVPVNDGPGVAMNHHSGGVPITLEDVDFQYETGNRPALDATAFEAEAGKTIALVGPSGAGKTTIAHLLMRFWDPQQGSITLGGRDLRDYHLDDLRGQIALVAQDTFLFNDTLRANILIARPDATEEELAATLERASLCLLYTSPSPRD